MLQKYSMGIGDRFGYQGKAQLKAMLLAKDNGVEITPVWNKSHREHSIIHTSPDDVRAEADQAIKALGWTGNYHVDADHIGMRNVDLFVNSSDFFTLDVAEFIGQPANEADTRAFVDLYKKYAGTLMIPDLAEVCEITPELIGAIARKYLPAVQQAGKIYRHIAKAKGKDEFVTEVSMDEADAPQSPAELFFILAAIADERIPAQTIAPKFIGRFNKGVDYVGDVQKFEKEFNDDLAVIAFAIKEFNLPQNLKLSVHSGSDKFSIYEPIKRAIRRFDSGLHVKTAGTTWLEELIGLAMAGGEGLKIAKEIYNKALDRFDELCGPYSTVIDIDTKLLPSPQVVQGWSGQEFANTLRHDQTCPQYNLHFRQLLHVGYKVAAEMGRRYLDMLEEFEDVIAANVTENIFNRHIKRIFIDSP